MFCDESRGQGKGLEGVKLRDDVDAGRVERRTVMELTVDTPFCKRRGIDFFVA